MVVAHSRSQKVLPVNTDPVASAVSHDVTNTHIVVSGVQNDVVKNPAVVSDSRRNALKSPEDTRGQNRLVSTIRVLPVIERPFIPA